jgi:molecular chaperone DnaK
VFLTADDNQSAVTIHVLQGERDMANGNKSPRAVQPRGIPPSPRGLPQIEVTFDIDARTASCTFRQDKATAKENKITIKANSGLSEDEIQRMVKGRRGARRRGQGKLALVNARNQADSLHQVKKSLAELGDKVGADEKSKIEAAAKELEEAIKGDDKARIESKTEALAKAAQKLGERMYADAQGAGASQAGPQPGAQAGAGEGKKADENVVDAEFTEVKDKK